MRISRRAFVASLAAAPHDLVVDREGSLYVAQFQSGGTYPLKFERI